MLPHPASSPLFPYTTLFRSCGAGNAANCRASLWAAIDAAGKQLAAAQGTDPTRWRADANAERITFVPGLLKTTLRYTNRPRDRKSTRLNSSHLGISYAVFCL